MLKIENDIPLARHCNIALGGNAKYFAKCTNDDDIREALEFASLHKLKLHILGGGSNTVFSDSGFGGLVLQVATSGIEWQEEGGVMFARVSAGEDWDGFVKACCKRGLSGIECLSGIPGFAGAAPIQNVGAYGQEAKDTITAVTALAREGLKTGVFRGSECQFGYRSSRFKRRDCGRFIISAVTFALQRRPIAEIRYPELAAMFNQTGGRGELTPLSIREAVLRLRRRKSMLADPGDPDSISVGSFFMAPVLSEDAFAALQAIHGQIPHFVTENGIKIPAGWLVEHSGFTRGFRRGGVGLSTKHALALVNYGGTTRELLALAEDIRRAVFEGFGIRLETEAVVVA